MSESCGGWLVRIIEHRSLRAAFIVGVVLAAGPFGPCSLMTMSALAQERDLPRSSTSVSAGVGASGNRDDGVDTEGDLKPGAARVTQPSRFSLLFSMRRHRSWSSPL